MKDKRALHAHFTAAMDAYALPKRRKAVLLAVSGGGDSMGLVALALNWRDGLPNPPPITALVVDHGLRQDSDSEAAAVAATLKSHGVAAEVVRVASKRPAAGVSVWARQQRYALLRDAAMRQNAVIITAHHQDDQLETIEMRLGRGSGLRGLRGMAAEASHLGVALLRPCLGLTRDELANVARDAGLPIVHDPSNHDTRFLRPKLRRDRILRNQAGVRDAQILRLGDLASRLMARVDAVLWQSAWVEINRFGCAHLSSQALGHQGFALMAGQVLARMHAKPYPPNDDALARLAERLQGGHDATLGGCEWRLGGRLKDKNILICREAEALPMLLASGQGVFDGRWRINYGGAVVVEPIGAERFAALKRILGDHAGFTGIPARAFYSMPVLRAPKGKIFTDKSRLILDDGTIFPHLIRTSTTKAGDAAVRWRTDDRIASFIGFCTERLALSESDGT